MLRGHLKISMSTAKGNLLQRGHGERSKGLSINRPPMDKALFVNTRMSYLDETKFTHYSPPGYMSANLTQLSRSITQETTHHHTVKIFCW